MGPGLRELVFCGFQQFIPELQESDIIEIDIFFIIQIGWHWAIIKDLETQEICFVTLNFYLICVSVCLLPGLLHLNLITLLKLEGKRRWGKKKHILKDKYGIKLRWFCWDSHLRNLSHQVKNVSSWLWTNSREHVRKCRRYWMCSRNVWVLEPMGENRFWDQSKSLVLNAEKRKS